jgi:hypothetical protein
VDRKHGPWKKGQSGNPKGRPKGQTLREAVRTIFAGPDPNQPGKSRYTTWAEALILEAESGKRDRLEVAKWLEGANPPENQQFGLADDLSEILRDHFNAAKTAKPKTPKAAKPKRVPPKKR